MSFGILPTGFNPKTYNDVLGELEDSFRTAFGDNVDLSAASFLGQIAAIVAEREALIWDLAQTTYASQDPDEASDISLDNIAAITGTTRLPATASAASVVAIGTAGTVLPAGRVVSVAGTGAQFTSQADATIAALSNWAAATLYAVGALVKSAGNVYSCTKGGVSGSVDPLEGTSSAIPDNGAAWSYCGVGSAAVAVSVLAQSTGALLGAAGTMTTIETPVGGWASAFNPLDASVGSDVETNAALRVRRAAELAAEGTGTADAIRAALLQVDEGTSGIVTAATVYENATDATDVNGVPPHAIECLVTGGADVDVLACIWANKPAGIATYGSTTGSVTDSQGIAHTVNFSRPTSVPIYLVVNVTVDASLWPADGPTEVQAAVVTYGAAQKAGRDAVSSALAAQVFSVPGVLDAQVLLGTAPSPSTTTTVAISVRQRATYDASRITVVVTPGTP